MARCACDGSDKSLEKMFTSLKAPTHALGIRHLPQEIVHAGIQRPVAVGRNGHGCERHDVDRLCACCLLVRPVVEDAIMGCGNDVS